MAENGYYYLEFVTKGDYFKNNPQQVIILLLLPMPLLLIIIFPELWFFARIIGREGKGVDERLKCHLLLEESKQ